MLVGFSPLRSSGWGPQKSPLRLAPEGAKVGCTYSSRGARITDTTATTDTIIAIAEERAELVTERVMRQEQGDKIEEWRQGRSPFGFF